MDLEADPGSIAPYDFRELWNVDWQGSELVPRGGAVPLMDEAFDGCWQLLTDFQTAAQRLYIVLGGCPDISANGRSVGFFDPDFRDSQFGDVINRMLYFPWIAGNAVLGSFDGDLYLGADSLYKKLHLTEPVSGEDPLQASGPSQDENIQSLPGYIIRCFADFDGKHFIAAENVATPTDSAIFIWDGSTFQKDLGGIVCPTSMVPFRDKLAIGFPSSENKIKLRPAGAVGTAYTDIAGLGAMGTTDMASHQDNLYGATGSTKIWKCDGTTITLHHTIAGATIRSVASLGGFLWFSYKSSTPHAIVGRWNEGASFTDVAKDLTAQNPLALDVGAQLRPYRQNLYTYGVATSTTGILFGSIGGVDNAPGDWEEIFSNPASAVPNCLQLVVF